MKDNITNTCLIPRRNIGWNEFQSLEEKLCVNRNYERLYADDSIVLFRDQKLYQS